MGAFPLKPLVPLVKWAHPMTKGLVSAMVLSEKGVGGSAVFLDAANRQKGSLSGSVSAVSDLGGNMIQFNGEGSGGGVIQYPTLLNQQDKTQVSFAFLYTRHASSSSFQPKWFMLLDSGGTAGKYLADNNLNATAMELDILWSGGDALFDWALPTTDALTLDVITYDGSSTTNVPSVYRNGVPLSVTTVASPSGTITTGHDTILTLGNHTAQSRTVNGKIGMFCMWNRLLSSSEVAQFSLNPWQIYRQPSLLN